VSSLCERLPDLPETTANEQEAKWELGERLRGFINRRKRKLKELGEPSRDDLDEDEMKGWEDNILNG
jgi:hypothetical protein